MLSAVNPMHPDLWEAKKPAMPRGMFGHQPNRWNGPPPMVRPGPPNVIYAPAPLKFPEIDPNLLPTKETTA
jgi:hypothetical protein